MFNQIHQVDSYLIWKKVFIKGCRPQWQSLTQELEAASSKVLVYLPDGGDCANKEECLARFPEEEKTCHYPQINSHCTLYLFSLSCMHCWLFKWIHTLLLLLSPPSKSWWLGVPLAPMIKLTAPPQGRNWLRGKEEFGEATRKKTLSMTISR